MRAVVACGWFGIQAWIKEMTGAEFHDFAGSVVVHALGGWLAKAAGAQALFAACGGLMLLWLLVAWPMKAPGRDASSLLPGQTGAPTARLWVNTSKKAARSISRAA